MEFLFFCRPLRNFFHRYFNGPLFAFFHPYDRVAKAWTKMPNFKALKLAIKALLSKKLNCIVYKSLKYFFFNFPYYLSDFWNGMSNCINNILKCNYICNYMPLLILLKCQITFAFWLFWHSWISFLSYKIWITFLLEFSFVFWRASFFTPE